MGLQVTFSTVITPISYPVGDSVQRELFINIRDMYYTHMIFSKLIQHITQNCFQWSMVPPGAIELRAMLRYHWPWDNCPCPLLDTKVGELPLASTVHSGLAPPYRNVRTGPNGKDLGEMALPLAWGVGPRTRLTSSAAIQNHILSRPHPLIVLR